MSESADQSQICPVCDSTNIESNVYNLTGICKECGFVLDQEGSVDIPEWASDIGDGTQTSQEAWLDYCRVTNGTEQQLAEAYATLEEIADKLPLRTQIRKESSRVYATAFRAEVTDGRDTKNMIAACLRIGSRQVGYPVPVKRLTQIDGISSTAFHKCVDAVCSVTEKKLTLVNPTEYLWFLERLLGLQEAHTEAARDLLQSIEQTGHLVGKNPAGIAAATVYETVDSVTQQQVADAVGVSTETIRLRATDIAEI
jgi:transcription initiation factor TFIIB